MESAAAFPWDIHHLLDLEVEMLALADGGSDPDTGLTSRATLNLLGTIVVGLSAAGVGLAVALLEVC